MGVQGSFQPGGASVNAMLDIEPTVLYSGRRSSGEVVAARRARDSCSLVPEVVQLDLIDRWSCGPRVPASLRGVS